MAVPLLLDALRVHPQDDVLVALRELQAGEANGERELAIWKTGVTL
jgi:hypothetical protein